MGGMSHLNRKATEIINLILKRHDQEKRVTGLFEMILLLKIDF